MASGERKAVVASGERKAGTRLGSLAFSEEEFRYLWISLFLWYLLKFVHLLCLAVSVKLIVFVEEAGYFFFFLRNRESHK